MRSYIWQGEFGNEIMWGYPEVCWAAREATAAGDTLRVRTRNPGAEALYRDVCPAKVIDERISPLTYAQKAFAVKNKNRGYYCRGMDGPNVKRGRFFRPLRTDIPWPRRRTRRAVIHAREMHNNKQNRNWRRALDDIVIFLEAQGYSVCCIGRSGQSRYIDHTENRMDLNLSEVIRIIKESACLIGPAGGPHLLATFCCTPIFSWNCKDRRLFPGYEGNPFGVAHFHPWSMEPTRDNLMKYHTMDYRLSLAELRKGVAWMLESL